MSPRPWSRAWCESARQFWSSERPADHFATSTGPVVAERIASLVREVDARLGHPDDLRVLEVGSAEGDLLAQVRDLCPELAARARWSGVDVRPSRVPGVESIVAEVPARLSLPPVRGLVMAHEWLDEIPCDVVERDGEGVDRVVLVDREGTEMLGPPLHDIEGCAEYGVDARESVKWLERWWPLRDIGDRAEVGLPRDRAWSWMASLVEAGTTVATDYGHVLEDRIGRHRHGTLVGYRSGRLARPRPDGGMNLTAHLALDSCAAALPGTTITRQRDELVTPQLGEDPGPRDVERHFDTLRLRDPARLGEVAWLRWDA